MSNKLVWNEQRKLTAAYLNGLAMALSGIGGFAPIIAMTLSGPLSPAVLILVPGCVGVSVGLHLLAKLVSGRLEE
ncbi:MAG TPA: amino acid transporter [Devosia sp.]|jgi:hypothetical protein|uniref:amino acid transporter n=1 Tax=Devosia sp. TaxID=1871048 RepID=UPI002F93A46D